MCSVCVHRLSRPPKKKATSCSRRFMSLHTIHKYVMHICLRVGGLGVSCYFHNNFISFCSSGTETGTMTQHDFTVYGAGIRWRKNRVDRAALNRFALIRYSFKSWIRSETSLIRRLHWSADSQTYRRQSKMKMLMLLKQCKSSLTVVSIKSLYCVSMRKSVSIFFHVIFKFVSKNTYPF